MKDLVVSVDYKVTITLSDNTKIELKSNVKSENNITSLNIDETLNIQNNNPVGVVSSSKIKLQIDSLDRSLIPSNPSSPYYGKMNTEATVEIQLMDSEGVVDFSKYFVSSWDSNIRESNPYQVIIEANDLLGIIGKNAVPNSMLKKNINTTDTLKNILDDLNKNLGDKYKINYDLNDLKFDEFPTLEYNNLEADNMNSWFNILAQSTLTNLYFARDNKLKTDYCLDDKRSEAVSNLRGDNNITSASIAKGGLVSYTGVKVNYIINSINNNTQLLTLSDQALQPGDNKFDNIEISGKVFKITGIKVETDQQQPVEIKDMQYNKRSASLVLNNTSQNQANCNIIIYGQTLKEDKLYVVKTKTSSNELLEVTNRLLPKSYIDKFASNLLKLIGIRESTIQATGHFNPRIKLGDQVYVNTQRLNISDYYKVIGLSWRLTGSLECTAKLMKTIV